MKPDYLPVYNGINLVELEYQNYITIAQIEDVTAIIDENFTYLTKEEANEKFVKQTQLAMEESPGIITLNEVYEAGMPFRGIFPYENKVLTYREVMNLKDGVYSIEGTKYFKCLNMPLIGKGIHDWGILKKKTLDIVNNEWKQTLLEYIPHDYGAGVNSVTMHFWNREASLDMELNKSNDNAGYWITNMGWNKLSTTNPRYAKLANGLTVQWFYALGKAVNGAVGTQVNFPIAFDNTCLIVLTNDIGNAVHCTAAVAKDRFSCLVWAKRVSIDSLIDSNMAIVAIGY